MNRRAFLGTLAGGLLAAPLGVGAQQAGKVARVAVLWTTNPAIAQPYRDAAEEGLRELGWVAGQNLILEHRFRARH